MADFSKWKARFGEAWREYEHRKGGRRRSALEFGKALGWPPSTFSEIATSEKPPKGEGRIERLSEVSGLHPGWLHYNVEPKYLPGAAQSVHDAPPAIKKMPGRKRVGDQKPGERAG